MTKDSRLEKFLKALCSLDYDDLPTPLSRVEVLWNCLITGEAMPDFQPQSRTEKYLMTVLGVYDLEDIPQPISRAEILLYKLATGDTDVDLEDGSKSRYELLLSEIVASGGVGGVDLEYLTYILSNSFNILYNTAEAPVKSAILKGNTLVNLVNNVTSNEVGSYNNSPCKINVNKNLQNETLTLIFNVTSLEIPEGADGILRLGGGWSGQVRYKPFLGINKVLYNYTQTTNNWLGVFSNSDAYNLGQRITVSDVMVLEGDYTNVDIPYFEGMQSVKMPVLTTTGKNLFDEINGSFKEKNSVSSTTGEITYYPNHVGVFENYIPVKPNTTYTLSGQLTDGNNPAFRVAFYQKDKAFNKTNNQYVANNGGGNRTSYTFTTSENEHYIRFSFRVMTQGYFQLEEGTIATKYEPFKSNILSTSEDIELRRIGDVKDELNLLTGELTQHTGEIVLNGSEKWTLSDNGLTNTIRFYTTFNPFKNASKLNNDGGFINILAGISSDDRKVIQTSGNLLFIRLYREEVSDVNSLKTFLTSKPLTVIGELSEESIKTVDLTTLDQDGNETELKTFDDITHVSLSSEGLIPEAELEVATKNEEDLDESIVYTTHTLSEKFNTLYNTAKKPVKSATLKGQTLINLSSSSGYKTVKFTSNETYKMDFQYETEIYKPNTKYLVITEFDHDYKYTFGVNVSHTKAIFNETIYIQDTVGRVYKHILTTKSDFTGCDTGLRTVVYNNTEETDFSQTYRIMIIEYQDGMENWDIPYFEGMNSVKMPVLKTSNSYYSKSNILSTSEDIELRRIGDVKDELNLLTGELSQRIGEIVFTGGESWKLDTSTNEFILTHSESAQRSPLLCANNYFNIYKGKGAFATALSGTPYEGIELGSFKEHLSKNPIIIQYNLATESVKTVDISTVDQDGNTTELSTFDDITHVTLSSEGLIPEAELEVAEKTTEVAASMFAISRKQEVINTTTNEQSENVDATMMATTEIYEQLL